MDLSLLWQGPAPCDCSQPVSPLHYKAWPVPLSLFSSKHYHLHVSDFRAKKVIAAQFYSLTSSLIVPGEEHCQDQDTLRPRILDVSDSLRGQATNVSLKEKMKSSIHTTLRVIFYLPRLPFVDLSLFVH